MNSAFVAYIGYEELFKQIEEGVIHRGRSRIINCQLKHIWRNKITEKGSLYSYSQWRRVEVFSKLFEARFVFRFNYYYSFILYKQVEITIIIQATRIKYHSFHKKMKTCSGTWPNFLGNHQL